MASNKALRYPSRTAQSEYNRNRKRILANHDVCAICGGPVDKDLPKYHPMSAEIDHIIPISKGGDPVAIENMQLTHRKCNRDKSDKLPSALAKRRETGVDPKGWLKW
jgi:5-methylcytosine-specific restriction endonuclease McrA